MQHYYDHPTEPNMSGDEFITPSVITDDGGKPLRHRRRRRRGDLLQLPRRPPARITKAFVLDRFHDGFDRGPRSSTSTTRP